MFRTSQLSGHFFFKPILEMFESDLYILVLKVCGMAPELG